MKAELEERNAKRAFEQEFKRYSTSKERVWLELEPEVHNLRREYDTRKKARLDDLVGLSKKMEQMRWMKNMVSI